VHVEADMVAEPMNKIATQAVALLIPAVLVDIVHGDFKKTGRGAAINGHAGLERGQGGILRAEDDIVNLRCRGVKCPLAGTVRVTSAA